MNSVLILCEQLLLYLPLVVGAYISFRLLGLPDFSIESAYVVGAIFATNMFSLVAPLSTVFQLISYCLVALIGGGIVGATSGILTRYLRLNHALSSIITMGLFKGVSYFFIKNGLYSFSYIKSPLALILPFKTIPALVTLLFLIVIFLIALSSILYTQLGYCIAAYGLNNRVFDNYPISARFVVIMGLIISNACAGLSGYLVAQSNGYVDVSMGFGIPLMCLSTIILGSLCVTKENPISLMIPLAGIAGYFLLQQSLLTAGFTSLYFSSAQAIIILLGIILQSRVRTAIANNYYQ
jgi:putative ABC transport system permease protein